MKKAFALGALSLSIACGREQDVAKPGGAIVHVLFDERHGLAGGEPVRFHDFEVGRVEKVDIAEARVRATLSIEPGIAAQLTRESTFSVESGESGAYLLAHVFDPEAEKLEEGGTLDGADSGIELGLRQASAEASRILSRVGSSEWSQDAKSVLLEIERAIDEVDWKEKQQAVKEQLDSARKGIEEDADYRVLRQRMDKLVEALRTLGRSEEAQELQKRIEELFGTKPEED